jgi:hypothetical protein
VEACARGHVLTVTLTFTGRRTTGVFAAAGLRSDLADALYELESDPGCNPFANDVGKTLRALNDRG